MNFKKEAEIKVGGRRSPLVVIGGEAQQGTYLLRIRSRVPLKIAFGRFRAGKLITVAPGDHLYVGSALGERGPSCLARRLVRHATRTGTKRPHPIRRQMLAEFQRIGLGSGDLRPASGKHLKWNVDHLLDQLTVDLVGAFLIRSPLRLEGEVGRLLAADPATIVFERGLGANDIPGNTHLLRVEAEESWWQGLPEALHQVLSDAERASELSAC